MYVNFSIYPCLGSFEVVRRPGPPRPHGLTSKDLSAYLGESANFFSAKGYIPCNTGVVTYYFVGFGVTGSCSSTNTGAFITRVGYCGVLYSILRQ